MIALDFLNRRALDVYQLLPVLTLVLCLKVAPAAATEPHGPEHGLFSAVLTDHVHDGRVDYPAIKKDPRFSDYLSQIESADTSAWSRAEQLAYWINVYNAQTIRIICDRYPLKSMMNKAAYALGRSLFQRKLIRLRGKKVSLNHIENNIVRPFGEPRVHFALVCGARGCPPLRAEAYLGSRLDAQLSDQVQRFLRQADKNRFDFSSQPPRAVLSPIFDWFKGDFEAHAPTILAYIADYLPSDTSTLVRKNLSQIVINYTDYDWRLNDMQSP